MSPLATAAAVLDPVAVDAADDWVAVGDGDEQEERTSTAAAAQSARDGMARRLGLWRGVKP